MTKLGPLTSQALGRSPYDIVVPNDLPDDEQKPEQEYDDRGRPINRETKMINRDIVRAHNEVMQVIGVAEPDSNIRADEDEDERRGWQRQHEDKVAHQLIHVGRVLGIVGVWGVNAVRQRILLYREYSHIPFHRLLQHELSRQSPWRALDTGLTAFCASYALRRVYSGKTGFWKHAALQYIRLHLQIFLFLQRTGIAPAEPPLPSLLYFVPFSAASPIGRLPPLPSTLSVGSVAAWIGTVAMQFAPVLVFYSYTRLWAAAPELLYAHVYRWLPTPTNDVSFRNQHYSPEYLAISARRLNSSSERGAGETAAETAEMAETAETVEAVAAAEMATTGEMLETTETPERTGATETPTSTPATSSEPMEPPPPPSSSAPNSPTVRRRNTVSSRGAGDDGYASEEEEFELSATLISFDVEAGDANDSAPSAWSAELRQSPPSADPNAMADNRADGGGYAGERGGDGGPLAASASVSASPPAGQGVPGPVYADNLLVQLPAIIATDIITVVISSTLMAPYEAFMIRFVARAYRHQHGQSSADLYGLAVLSPSCGSLNGTSLTNCVGIWVTNFAVDAAGWLLVTSLAALYRGAEPGWSFWRLLRTKLGWEKP